LACLPAHPLDTVVDGAGLARAAPDSGWDGSQDAGVCAGQSLDIQMEMVPV